MREQSTRTTTGELGVHFDFETMLASEHYKLLQATVLPRPIAWVTTRDAWGATAPFSFFNVFANDPATVVIGIGSKGPTEPKDTRANIRENRAICRQASAALARAGHACHFDSLPKRVEEPSEAGLSLAAPERVGVPRIAKACLAMECTFMQEIGLASFVLALGKIPMVHVHDEAVIDANRQYVDANKLDLIGRMEGAWYATTREMPPIALSDWNDARSKHRLVSGSK